MQVLTMGNELLRQKAVKIEKTNSETDELVRKMFEVLQTERGVGLAGPQVGVMKRIFVTNAVDDEKRVFINPSILETSVETSKYEEGCLSIPGVYCNVVRSEKVKVQAWNEKGKPFTIEAAGILARVIQHEYDHLEGVLFLDRVPEDKREKLIAKFEKGQRTGDKGQGD